MTRIELTPSSQQVAAPQPVASASKLGPGAPLHRAEGVAINVADLAEAVAAITSRAQERRGFTLLPLTFPTLAAMRRDLRVRAAYAAASFVTAGATPIAWLAGGRSARIARVSGRDLVTPLAEAATKLSLKLFLIGKDDGQLARAGKRLSLDTDGAIDIAGSLALPVGSALSGGELDELLARIRASGAHLGLIALDSPRQELLATRAAACARDIGFVCLGEAFDGRDEHQERRR